LNRFPPPRFGCWPSRLHTLAVATGSATVPGMPEASVTGSDFFPSNREPHTTGSGATPAAPAAARAPARFPPAAEQRPGRAGYETATLTTIFTTDSGSAQAPHGAWASSGKRIMNWPVDSRTGTIPASAANSPASCASS
jgi:hypothetical protein